MFGEVSPAFAGIRQPEPEFFEEGHTAVLGVVTGCLAVKPFYHSETVTRSYRKENEDEF